MKRYQTLTNEQGRSFVRYQSPCRTAAVMVECSEDDLTNRAVLAFFLRGLRFEATQFIKRREVAPLIPLTRLFPGLGKRKPTELERIGFLHRGA
jgi:hypothetical protein